MDGGKIESKGTCSNFKECGQWRQMSASEALTLFVAGCIAAFQSVYLASLAMPGVVEGYPFLWTDSFDWIANAVYYVSLARGESYLGDPSIRQPLFVFITALAFSRDMLWILPVLNQLLVFGAWFVAWLLMRRLRVPGSLSSVLLLIAALHHCANKQAFYFMADPLAVFLMLISLYFYTRAFETEEVSEPPLFMAAFLSSLATVTQFYGLFPCLVASGLLAGLFVLNFRKWLYLKLAAANLLVGCSLQAIWMVFKAFQFSSSTATQVNHFRLLGFSLNNLEFYANVWPVFFAPVLILALVVLCYRRVPSVKALLQPSFLIVAGVTAAFAFFVFIYQWKDARFTSYFLLPGLVTAGVIMGDSWDRSPKTLRVVLSVWALYLSIIPIHAVLGPRLESYLSIAANPPAVWNNNRFAKLARQGRVDRIDMRCVSSNPTAEEGKFAEDCHEAIYINIVRYLKFVKGLPSS